MHYLYGKYAPTSHYSYGKYASTSHYSYGKYAKGLKNNKKQDKI